MVFNAAFSYIVEVSFIGGGNRKPEYRRKSPTYLKVKTMNNKKHHTL
jgi:hypothetical protein